MPRERTTNAVAGPSSTVIRVHTCTVIPSSFIMDYSMSKMAKYFRMLGYDTICDQRVTQLQLLPLAVRDGRLLITCSPELARQLDHHNKLVLAQTPAAPPQRQVVAYDSDGESIYSEDSDSADTEVQYVLLGQWRSRDFAATMTALISTLGLRYELRNIFSRCVTCNDRLMEVAKTLVKGRVEPRIFDMYEGFTECPRCRKVYWGFDGENVINYKTYRTLDLLRSLCVAAGTYSSSEGKCLSSLKAFRSFPRKVKVAIFCFLSSEDLAQVVRVFPVLRDLKDEVEESRLTGQPVAPFKKIKSCK